MRIANKFPPLLLSAFLNLLPSHSVLQLRCLWVVDNLYSLLHTSALQANSVVICLMALGDSLL